MPLKYFFLLVIIISISFSCLNYIPCRGQYYTINNITHQELIDKFIEFRENYPEYDSFVADRINEHVPHYYIHMKWPDSGKGITCDIHIGDQIPNPPTRLNFNMGFYDSSKSKWLELNSGDLDKDTCDIYKRKFESEILDKMGLKWQRKACS